MRKLLIGCFVLATIMLACAEDRTVDNETSLGYGPAFKVVDGFNPRSVVIAANHFSHVDPFVAAVAAGRPTRFLGVDELFGRSRFFDGLTYYLGVIPMPRGTVPLQSMRTALNHLGTGGGVTLFPEGRRVSEWGESPPKQGAAWLAMRVKCPLIPMALWGTGEAMGLDDLKLRRHPIRVAIGAPLYPAQFSDRAVMTNAWYEWMDDALIMLGARQ